MNTQRNEPPTLNVIRPPGPYPQNLQSAVCAALAVKCSPVFQILNERFARRPAWSGESNSIPLPAFGEHQLDEGALDARDGGYDASRLNPSGVMPSLIPRRLYRRSQNNRASQIPHCPQDLIAEFRIITGPGLRPGSPGRRSPAHSVRWSFVPAFTSPTPQVLSCNPSESSAHVLRQSEFRRRAWKDAAGAGMVRCCWLR